MKYFPVAAALAMSLISACTHTTRRCEEIEDVIAQRQECEDLERRIKQTDSVVVRTNLQNVYDEQCVNLRFYRDGFDDDQVCSSQQREEGVKKATKEIENKEQAEQ